MAAAFDAARAVADGGAGSVEGPAAAQSEGQRDRQSGEGHSHVTPPGAALPRAGNAPSQFSSRAVRGARRAIDCPAAPAALHNRGQRGTPLAGTAPRPGEAAPRRPAAVGRFSSGLQKSWASTHERTAPAVCRGRVGVVAPGLHPPRGRRAARGTAGREPAGRDSASAGGGGMPFAEPPVRASRNGVLDTTLTARLAPVRIGDRVATSTAFDGAFTGPTLRVRRRGAPARGPGQPPGAAHRPSRARLARVALGQLGQHLRGACDARPALPVRVDLPADHPAGLYWYHPQRNGVSDAQVFGGMAGALIVEGDLDALPGRCRLARAAARPAGHVESTAAGPGRRSATKLPDFPLLKDR